MINRKKINEEARNIYIDYDLSDYMPEDFDAKGMVVDLLERLGIEIEPKPVLPGITQGEFYISRYGDETGESWRIYSGGSYTVVAYGIKNEADARLFCVALKLAQGMYDCVAAYDDPTDVIHIDVHVDKFRKLLEEAGANT